MSTHTRPAVAVAACALADGCAVLAFVVIGVHAHHVGGGAGQVWHVAWPFLAGLAIGLASVRAWRAPLALVPAGLGAWLGAAGAGMIIRVLAGQGSQASFVVVALGFLAVFVLGWRVAARIVTTRLAAVH
jgi:hypothetical protein